MSKKILIDASFPKETRVALVNSENKIEDIDIENELKVQNKGNIYLVKVTKIEPALQAAFVDYGTDKNGFLPFSEISPLYYHIPVADKQLLLNGLNEIDANKALYEPETKDFVINNQNHINHDQNSDLAYQQDEDSIDVSDIESLIEEKIEVNFDTESVENDIEPININNNGNQAYDSKIEHSAANKSYKIQEVIKKGQILLAQLVKEERGNKGASFSTYISLAGKYCVLIPNKDAHNGISRKIASAEERARLKSIIEQLTISANSANNCSIVVRTAGAGRSASEIAKDYNYLVRLWNNIRETTLKSVAPCFIHQEDGIIQKCIRDMCDHSVKEVIIQGENAYKLAHKFISDIASSDKNKVKKYERKIPIFSKFGIEEQISKLYQPVVCLKSGGYIVINPTEALVSIDVNSGRSTSERNIEETALKINLEAAKEVAKQAILRDLSGLIVIDFIDMGEAKHRRIVERSVKEFFGADKAKVQISSISPFGLLEMSRQRLRSSFLELHSAICNNCSGKGVVRERHANSMLILRTIENEICLESSFSVLSAVNTYASNEVVMYILNNNRNEILIIESKYSLKLNFYIDDNCTSDSFAMEKVKVSTSSISGKRQNQKIHQQSVDIDDSDYAHLESAHDAHKADKISSDNAGNASKIYLDSDKVDGTNSESRNDSNLNRKKFHKQKSSKLVNSAQMQKEENPNSLMHYAQTINAQNTQVGTNIDDQFIDNPYPNESQPSAMLAKHTKNQNILPSKRKKWNKRSALLDPNTSDSDTVDIPSNAISSSEKEGIQENNKQIAASEKVDVNKNKTGLTRVKSPIKKANYNTKNIQTKFTNNTAGEFSDHPSDEIMKNNIMNNQADQEDSIGKYDTIEGIVDNIKDTNDGDVHEQTLDNKKGKRTYSRNRKKAKINR